MPEVCALVHKAPKSASSKSSRYHAKGPTVSDTVASGADWGLGGSGFSPFLY